MLSYICIHLALPILTVNLIIKPKADSYTNVCGLWSGLVFPVTGGSSSQIKTNNNCNRRRKSITVRMELFSKGKIFVASNVKCQF